MIETTAIVGFCMIVSGVTLSLLTFAHDLRRGRISRTTPQAAPKRMLPEIHALAAILAGAGAGLLWSRPIGGLCVVAYALVVYLVIRPLIERL